MNEWETNYLAGLAARTAGKLTPIQSRTLAMLNEGKSQAEIAAQLGVTPSRVWAILKALKRKGAWEPGQRRHPTDLTPRQQEALELRRQGLTIRECGEKMGITYSRAHTLVSTAVAKSYYIKRRKQAGLT